MTLPEPALAGVMGWPVKHSRSPVIYGHWLKEHSVTGHYVHLPVAPDGLEAALSGLAPLGFRGCNVTIPHKQTVARLVDHLGPVAARLGAVNTVVVLDDGTLQGRNTDGFGFLQALAPARPDFTRPAVVLGAGGAARAIVAALLDAGVPELRLVNRTAARIDALAADLDDGGRIIGMAEPRLADAGLLVNTTSLGMDGQPPLNIDLDGLAHDTVVNDIVYTPLETPLLAAARARGNPVIDGLGMLLHQARPGFEAWFGVMPEVTSDLRRAVEATLAS